jgi:hypothetical protein
MPEKKLSEEEMWDELRLKQACHCEDCEKTIKSFLRQSNRRAREAALGEAVGIVKDRKKPDYDGNDLQSACNFHRIGAQNWTEIIRLEEGMEDENMRISSGIKKLLIDKG